MTHTPDGGTRIRVAKRPRRVATQTPPLRQRSLCDAFATAPPNRPCRSCHLNANLPLSPLCKGYEERHGELEGEVRGSSKAASRGEIFGNGHCAEARTGLHEGNGARQASPALIGDESSGATRDP